MLDAQFDFNLYDKAVGAIAFEEGNWQDLVETNRASLAAYGAHHLMGNITEIKTGRDSHPLPTAAWMSMRT